MLAGACRVLGRLLIRGPLHSNIGGGPENTLSLLELIDLLKKLTGKAPRLTFASWRPADQKVYVSNISKAIKLLNWKPVVGPDEGIRKLVKWMSDNRSLFTERKE